MSDDREFQAFSPTGSKIVGTADVVYGVARLIGFKKTDKGFDPEYSGDTDIDWNSQEHQTEFSTISGKEEPLYEDENGGIWTESALQFRPVDDEAPKRKTLVRRYEIHRAVVVPDSVSTALEASDWADEVRWHPANLPEEAQCYREELIDGDGNIIDQKDW